MAEQKLTVAEKFAKLQDNILNIEKQWGKGSIMVMGKEPEAVPVISSGNIGFDFILGGGFGQGRIVELLGIESSGKTSLCLHTIAETQKNGGICAIIDAEHSLDPQYAKSLGVKMEELVLNQPDHGEQAVEIAIELISSGLIDLVVIDSVAALTPKSEIEGEMGEAQMGKHARLMSQAMRKIVSVVGRTKTTVIFTNQWRSKIGGYIGGDVATGGNALKFYASQRIDLRRSEITKEGEEAIGTIIKAKNLKNKIAVPFKTIEISNKFGEGFSKYMPLLALGLEQGLVEKSGSWYSINGEKIGQGKENAMNYLKENETVAQALDLNLRKMLFPNRYLADGTEATIVEKKPRKVAKKEEETIQATEESE